MTRQSFPNPWDDWNDEQRTIFIREAGPTMIKFGLCDETELRLASDLETDPEVARFCAAVKTALPPGAAVAVVSKGDDRLLKLSSAWKAGHFPQDESGEYLGYHPADSSEARSHLERLRALGTEYLAFPESSKWWLDQYTEFRKHLEREHTVILQIDTCTIFALRASPANGRSEIHLGDS